MRTPHPQQLPSTALSRRLEKIKDNHSSDGIGHEIKGAVKEQVGQSTGNRTQQIEGNIEKNADKAEQMIDALVDRMIESENKP